MFSTVSRDLCHHQIITPFPSPPLQPQSSLSSDPDPMMEKLVEVSEQEVCIDFALNCKRRATVRLKSLITATPIAFKVQTSSPHKFLVNPPCGLIQPLSYATFQVILKPQSQFPPSFPRSPSDRFLIRTTLAPDFSHNSSDSTHPDSINSWFSSRPQDSITHDIKLKVAFVGPLLLFHAVSNGDIDAVRNLIKRHKSIVSELSDNETESLLRVANELSNSDPMINFLVEAGLKTDARDRLGDTCYEDMGSSWVSKGWTDVHVAVAFDRTDEITSLIKKSERGSLDCRDKEGRTPLHFAASKGNLRSARLLLDAGANLDKKSKDGRTALYWAAENGDCRMVSLLIDMGADPTITTNDRGRSAVDVARDKGHKEVVEILERGEIVLNAARRGDKEHLESLLQKGASMNYCDQYSLSPLHVASIKGHKDAVLLLVEYGSDLECEDNEGHSPLHLAVEGGCIETVKVLIDYGANVNAKTKRGATPVYMARAMGYDDISKLLLNKGASALHSSSSSSLSSSMLH